MLTLFSHALAFSVLLIASVYDLKTSEVPDFIFLPGLIGGVLLHGLYSFQTGSVDPLVWSLGIGLIFSIYGWLAYYLGMWGGADAMAISVLGFAAPFGLEEISTAFSVDLFLNILYVGFIYTILFSTIKAYKNMKFRKSIIGHFKDNKKTIAFELGFVIAFSVIISYHSALGYNYFVVLIAMLSLVHFLKIVEENAFKQEISVDKVTPGEVIESEEVDNKIKGVTKQELENIESEKVIVKEGIRFIPVFPIALLLTDLSIGGIQGIIWGAEILFA